MNGYGLPAEERRPACVVRTNPESEAPCGRPAGEHTVLEWPICDQCYEATCF